MLKTIRLNLCCAGLLGCLLLTTWATAEDKDTDTKQDSAAPTQADLDARFEKMLSGSSLVGKFTVVGQDAPPKEEKYTMTKVSKVAGDIWLFQTRIQYGGHDVTLPLPLPVKWAGDTPVITLDSMPIPGLGTFSARVLFAEGKYAGTWSAKDHGGHLFGRIVPAGEDAAEKPALEKKNEK